MDPRRSAPDGRGSLIAKTHYPQKPNDWGDAPWLPSAVLHLMQQPVPTCTGKSIGFLPLNIREATAEERAKRPELAGVPIIDKAAGIEYAVAPLPCNPQAQMEAVSKGREAGLIDDEFEALLSAAWPFREMTPTRSKTTHALNEHGFSVARSLIIAGDVDESGSWSFDAKDENAILGTNQDWHRYSGCFLGIDASSDPRSKAHYHYPFAKFAAGKLTLFRHALNAIRARSPQENETGIFEASGRLLDLLDSHGKAVHFVRPLTVRRAIEREILALRPVIRKQIHDQIRDVFCAATGRVS